MRTGCLCPFVELMYEPIFGCVLESELCGQTRSLGGRCVQPARNMFRSQLSTCPAM
jgi:hypothetical protein